MTRSHETEAASASDRAGEGDAPRHAPLPVGASGRIEAVCVVDRLHADSGSVGATAIDKRAVNGPVKVGELGLYADVQADRVNHGGADQAVYILDADEADRWAGELGRELHPGVFGENLLVRGLAIDDLELGARIAVGTAVLEATDARTPCATFERWIGEEGFRARFHQRGRVGVYFRVLEKGQVVAGDEARVVGPRGTASRSRRGSARRGTSGTRGGCARGSRPRGRACTPTSPRGSSASCAPRTAGPRGAELGPRRADARCGADAATCSADVRCSRRQERTGPT